MNLVKDGISQLLLNESSEFWCKFEHKWNSQGSMSVSQWYRREDGYKFECGGNLKAFWNFITLWWRVIRYAETSELKESLESNQDIYHNTIIRKFIFLRVVRCILSINCESKIYKQENNLLYIWRKGWDWICVLTVLVRCAFFYIIVVS